MNQTAELREDSQGPTHGLILAVRCRQGMEQELRQVIARKRGELHALRAARYAADLVHVHLSVRRVDDVMDALEGAGFDIDTVVATSGPVTRL